MKTILVIVYDEATDTAKYRVVQGAKFGDTEADMTNAEKNQAKSLVKKLTTTWKGKPIQAKAGN